VKIETPTTRTIKALASFRRLIADYAFVPALGALAARPVPPKPSTVGPDRFLIMAPDSASIFIDKAGRAHRVEDLEPALRQEVEAAIERSKTEDSALPSNESLREASRVLWLHVRHLPVVERIAITTAVARGLVDAEVRVREEVRQAHRPPLTLERFAAMVCPDCLLYSASSDISPALARALVRASDRARDVLVRIWGEAEVSRRQNTLAYTRMWVAQGRVEPPALTGRRGATADGKKEPADLKGRGMAQD
jgi:hypothetical protein